MRYPGAVSFGCLAWGVSSQRKFPTPWSQCCSSSLVPLHCTGDHAKKCARGCNRGLFLVIFVGLQPYSHYMAKQQRNSGARRYAGPTEPSPFEQARDELFKYMTERFPELSEQQIAELKTLGLRFAQPPKARTEGNAASAA